MKKGIRIVCTICFLLVGLWTSQCGNMEHSNILDPENPDTQGKVTIWIDHPEDGDSVTMEYIITGSVLPRAEIRVLLRALTTNEYWVQDVPVVDNHGKWQTVCWFGSETVGMGDYYEVFAITPRIKLLPEDVLPSLPEYTNMSNRVTVYRPE